MFSTLIENIPMDYIYFWFRQEMYFLQRSCLHRVEGQIILLFYQAVLGNVVRLGMTEGFGNLFVSSRPRKEKKIYVPDDFNLNFLIWSLCKKSILHEIHAGDVTSRRRNRVQRRKPNRLISALIRLIKVSSWAFIYSLYDYSLLSVSGSSIKVSVFLSNDRDLVVLNYWSTKQFKWI